jgi:hypothetical protein
MSELTSDEKYIYESIVTYAFILWLDIRCMEIGQDSKTVQRS